MPPPQRQSGEFVPRAGRQPDQGRPRAWPVRAGRVVCGADPPAHRGARGVLRSHGNRASLPGVAQRVERREEVSVHHRLERGASPHLVENGLKGGRFHVSCRSDEAVP